MAKKYPNLLTYCVIWALLVQAHTSAGPGDGTIFLDPQYYGDRRGGIYDLRDMFLNPYPGRSDVQEFLANSTYSIGARDETNRVIRGTEDLEVARAAGQAFREKYHDLLQRRFGKNYPWAIDPGQALAVDLLKALNRLDELERKRFRQKGLPRTAASIQQEIEVRYGLPEGTPIQEYHSHDYGPAIMQDFRNLSTAEPGEGPLVRKRPKFSLKAWLRAKKAEINQVRRQNMGDVFQLLAAATQGRLDFQDYDVPGPRIVYGKRYQITLADLAKARLIEYVPYSEEALGGLGTARLEFHQTGQVERKRKNKRVRRTQEQKTFDQLYAGKKKSLEGEEWSEFLKLEVEVKRKGLFRKRQKRIVYIDQEDFANIIRLVGDRIPKKTPVETAYLREAVARDDILKGVVEALRREENWMLERLGRSRKALRAYLTAVPLDVGYDKTVTHALLERSRVDRLSAKRPVFLDPVLTTKFDALDDMRWMAMAIHPRFLETRDDVVREMELAERKRIGRKAARAKKWEKRRNAFLSWLPKEKKTSIEVPEKPMPSAPDTKTTAAVASETGKKNYPTIDKNAPKKVGLRQRMGASFKRAIRSRKAYAWLASLLLAFPAFDWAHSRGFLPESPIGIFSRPAEDFSNSSAPGYSSNEWSKKPVDAYKLRSSRYRINQLPEYLDISTADTFNPARSKRVKVRPTLDGADAVVTTLRPTQVDGRGYFSLGRLDTMKLSSLTVHHDRRLLHAGLHYTVYRDRANGTYYGRLHGSAAGLFFSNTKLDYAAGFDFEPASSAVRSVPRERIVSLNQRLRAAGFVDIPNGIDDWLSLNQPTMTLNELASIFYAKSVYTRRDPGGVPQNLLFGQHSGSLVKGCFYGECDHMMFLFRDVTDYLMHGKPVQTYLISNYRRSPTDHKFNTGRRHVRLGVYDRGNGGQVILDPTPPDPTKVGQGLAHFDPPPRPAASSVTPTELRPRPRTKVRGIANVPLGQFDTVAPFYIDRHGAGPAPGDPDPRVPLERIRPANQEAVRPRGIMERFRRLLGELKFSLQYRILPGPKMKSEKKPQPKKTAPRVVAAPEPARAAKKKPRAVATGRRFVTDETHANRIGILEKHRRAIVGDPLNYYLVKYPLPRVKTLPSGRVLHVARYLEWYASGETSFKTLLREIDRMYAGRGVDVASRNLKKILTQVINAELAHSERVRKWASKSRRGKIYLALADSDVEVNMEPLLDQMGVESGKQGRGWSRLMSRGRRIRLTDARDGPLSMKVFGLAHMLAATDWTPVKPFKPVDFSCLVAEHYMPRVTAP